MPVNGKDSSYMKTFCRNYNFTAQELFLAGEKTNKQTKQKSQKLLNVEIQV